VNLPARPAAPAIVMPPMPAPAACTHKLVIRADDAPKVVRRRLAHFHEQIAPLRSHFAARGLLVDYEVLGGMEHTTPRLMDAILSHVVTAAAKGPYENGVKKRMESDNMKINPMGGIH
jgi:adenylate kinase